MSDRTLREDLARYLDLEAFIAKRVGREKGMKLAERRKFALKRAACAIRFFKKEENRARLDAYRGPLAEATPNTPDMEAKNA